MAVDPVPASGALVSSRASRKDRGGGLDDVRSGLSLLRALYRRAGVQVPLVRSEDHGHLFQVQGVYG